MSERQLYGYYSAKAEAMCGSLFYRCPDGGEVIVTCVSEAATLDEAKKEYLWPDIVARGPVTNCVRQGVPRPPVGCVIRTALLAGYSYKNAK